MVAPGISNILGHEGLEPILSERNGGRQHPSDVHFPEVAGVTGQRASAGKLATRPNGYNFAHV